MQNPERSECESSVDPRPASESSTNRRAFLVMGLSVLLAGCGPQRTTSPLPRPAWRSESEMQQYRSRPEPRPRPPRSEPTPSRADTVLARNQWASDGPVPSRMNRLGAVRYITVHHDGMSTFYETDSRATADRIDRIRRYHREQLGWGDIGYHYIIDRSGRVWEGRPLRYQGAHVRDHNENNLGVMLLGNFDQQQPSSAQLQALRNSLRDLMQSHRVSRGDVLTHREWAGATTICPGRSLQHYMDTSRNNRTLG